MDMTEDVELRTYTHRRSTRLWIRSHNLISSTGRIWGTFRKYIFPGDPTGWTIHRREVAEFGWSKRLPGGGPAKSLKVEAAKASNQPGPQSKGFGPALGHRLIQKDVDCSLYSPRLISQQIFTRWGFTRMSGCYEWTSQLSVFRLPCDET
jgi:hypothetical protein